MAVKVYELARELGMASKDLIEKAGGLGIEVRSHMSALSDSDAARLRKADTSGPAADKTKASAQKAASASRPAGDPAAVRPARPNIITVSARSGEQPAGIRRRPPIGRPIVDNAYLENKHRKSGEAAAKAAEEQAGKAAEKPADKPAAAVAAAGQAEKKAPAAEMPAASGREKAAAPEAEAVPETTIKTEPKAKSAVGTGVKTAGAEAPEAKKTVSAAPEAKKVAPAAPEVPVPETRKAPSAGTKAGAAQEPQKKTVRSGRSDDGGRTQAGEQSSQGGRARSGDRSGAQRGASKQGGYPQSREQRGSRRDSGGRDTDGRTQRSADSRRRSDQSGQTRTGNRPGSSKQGERKRYADKYDKGRHSKYDKLERKSLEKQTKNKHTKYKQNDVEAQMPEEVLPEGTIVLNVPITVAGFCEQTEVSTSKVIMTLMKLGIMANINQTIDEDTVMVLADELGINVHIGNVEEEEAESGIEVFEDDEADLKPRPPVITVMGHVDHGKTSLLDAIRKTNVTASESGGITQQIGASEVRIKGHKIVFLDTPGHEAFTAMRARGAHITDIAVLVVAADDGVMPQTVESISHAKAAGVPIIVAINKMDKPGANPDRVKQELADHGVLVEDWGGSVISVPVSAKTGEGITNLLEMILLQAEMLELKANPNRLAMGSVIEARLDKAKGPVASLLVMNGTLQSGQSLVAGTCSGRIRLMTDYKGRPIKKAGPATAVEVLGLTDVPQAGDEFNSVREDRLAREIAERRKEKLREEVLARNSSMSLDKLFSRIQEGEVKELDLIIKGDVQGSIGALVASLEKLNNDEVKVNIIHTGVGTVTESDVMLAGTSGAVIIGFNVRPSTAVQSMADRDGIEIRTYRVIYDVIDDVEAAMKGMLAPEFKEELLGKVEIRNTFKVPGVGIVGGAYVTEGRVMRNAEIRLVRDGIVVHEGKISSLKRFKDDAREVAQGYECGIGIENYNDIKEGDVIECFRMVETSRA